MPGAQSRGELGPLPSPPTPLSFPGHRGHSCPLQRQNVQLQPLSQPGGSGGVGPPGLAGRKCQTSLVALFSTCGCDAPELPTCCVTWGRLLTLSGLPSGQP